MKNICIEDYLDKIRNSIDECLKDSDKERAKAKAKKLMLIIKTIREYVKILLLEEEYTAIRLSIDKHKKMDIDRANKVILESQERINDLIMKSDEENLDEIIELQGKIADENEFIKKLEIVTSKHAFLEYIKEENMVTDKKKLIENFIKESSIDPKFLNEINLFDNNKLNMTEISFCLDILSGDLSQYSILATIDKNLSDISNLESQIKGLEGKVESIKIDINSYNNSIKKYMKIYEDLTSRYLNEEKYYKLFKVLPFMRNILIKKDERKDISFLRNELKRELSKISDISYLLMDCPKIKIEHIDSSFIYYYGNTPELQKFNVRSENGSSVSHYKFTEDNLIDPEVLADLTDRDFMAPIGEKIIKLKKEIDSKKLDLNSLNEEINSSDYKYIVDVIVKSLKLSSELEMTKLQLEALQVMNYLESHHSSRFIDCIIPNEQIEEFKNTTGEKVLSYKSLIKKH